MPKQKITKEMIIETAFEIVRKEGLENLLVKNIAAKLNCSVQPIYSYCANMEGVKQELVARTAKFIREYVAARIDKKDYFRSTGRSYLKFAKDEPNLFQLYFLRQQPDVYTLDDLYRKESSQQVGIFIAESLGIGIEQAKALHLHMIIYVMGISAMAASTNIDVEGEDIQNQLDMAYNTFLAQLKGETHGKDIGNL
ncbi:TetR/AcrR family transcriptional regulator [Emergencia timonensis]|uniref:TetR/AcrR family transcriptional regulator n=1 Tax=Emergencia timonensis TaxID=1776384 RepID=UPI0039924A58